MNSDFLNNSSIEIELVKEFTLEVGEAMKRLAPKIGHNYKLLTDDDIQEIFNSPNTFLMIARDIEKKQIVGMTTLLVYRIPYIKKASIEDVVVDEEYRGRGIGKLLMEKAMNIAREKGAVYIDLTSSPDRVASNSLYKKLGFEVRKTNVYRKIIDYGEV